MGRVGSPPDKKPPVLGSSAEVMGCLGNPPPAEMRPPFGSSAEVMGRLGNPPPGEMLPPFGSSVGRRPKSRARRKPWNRSCGARMFLAAQQTRRRGMAARTGEPYFARIAGA
jgi:hypothetical protein